MANNKYNTEELNLNPPEKVKEKLDYYRSFFNKIQDLTTDAFDELSLGIRKFFNLKAVGFTDQPPDGLIRISNNNRIFAAQRKDVNYLSEISQLLAPPIVLCGYNRCNVPGQQVLYCSTSEAGAYWETRPQNGDVITISHFELKPNSKVNCNVVRSEKKKQYNSSNPLEVISFLLENFLLDVYSLEVLKERPKDYLFSAILASDQLFYPAVSENNIEAYLYPSVQKKKFGLNFAIRNDLILERYNLIGVETRFILDEYANLNPSSDEVTTDQFLGSFGTRAFDFDKGKILYDKKADEIFSLFRRLQTQGGPQYRNEHLPDNVPKNLAFDLSPKNIKVSMQNKKATIVKFNRNDKVNVVYQDGRRFDNIKYKKVEVDITKGKCRIVKYL